jgi:hypothetical protein
MPLSMTRRLWPDPSKTLVVDVAVRIRPLADRVSRVTGTIQIDTGHPDLDARIWRLFRQASLDTYELLGGPARVDKH